MRLRECGFYDSNTEDEGGFWDAYRFHTRPFVRRVALGPHAIDETPVTNAEYAEFITRSGYQPLVKANFLKHWRDGQPPAGREDHPVVSESLEDARAYAKWAGKHLPTEEEWQYAAQGAGGRTYPWGNDLQPACCAIRTRVAARHRSRRSPRAGRPSAASIYAGTSGSGPKASAATATPGSASFA